MSRHLGAIRQLGYVVPDIDQAIAHWSDKLGVGPFFLNPQVPIRNYQYRGQAYTPHNSVALANAGFIQVELIQVRDDTPSMYRDYIARHGYGLQHVAYWTEQYDADLQRLIDLGWQATMQGEVGERGRFIYFDTEHHPGTVIELSEVAGPKGRLFKAIHDASLHWDGSEPVRPFPDLSTL